MYYFSIKTSSSISKALMLFVACIFFVSCKDNDKIKPSLELSTGILDMTVAGGKTSFTITCNTDWEILIDDPWVTADLYEGNGTGVVTVNISANNSGKERNTTLSVHCASLKETIEITQDMAYLDGTVISYQTSSASDATRPVHLVVVGDGFINQDYEKGGAFDKAADIAIEAFFSLEPYPTYRDHFSVYKVVAYSQERGATVQTNFHDLSQRRQTRNTVFSSILEGGNSTGIDCDEEAVFKYAMKVPAITARELPNTTVIVVINLDVYAGTSIMWSDGKAIALCPTGNTLEEIVRHEAGGHAFAKLADEYIYFPEQSFPLEDREELMFFRQNDVWSFGANLSISNNPEEIHWKHYFETGGYEAVGIYEGGGMYGRDVWRPEDNSCMNDNSSYFNAPSREAIVRRIMSISNKSFDYDDFYKKDKVRTMPLSRSARETRQPLAPPILRR